MSLSYKAATGLVRHATRQQAPGLRSSAAAMQRRNRADASTNPQFTSLFSKGTGDAQDTTKIPSFAKYRGGSETGNKMFQYFMVGTMGGVTALGAKNTVQGEQHYPRQPMATPHNNQKDSFLTCLCLQTS